MSLFETAKSAQPGRNKQVHPNQSKSKIPTAGIMVAVLTSVPPVATSLLGIKKQRLSLIR